MADEFLGPNPLRAGSTDSPATGTYVAQLQTELRRAAVLQATDGATPGVFDAVTEDAVRRLQWFAANVPGALAAGGAYVPRGLVALAIDGVAGPGVKNFLQRMQAQGWTATGLLVKVDFNDWRRMAAGNGFGALAGARNLGLCERSFASVLDGMNSAASDFGVWIFVNQLFRVEGNAVTGAVVQPATSSAHKIGRAIDLQLGTDANTPRLSTEIRTAPAGSPFAEFRDHAKNVLGCRYGGDFGTADPPHFDQQILPAGQSPWNQHFFFDQLQYRQSLRNPAAIPFVAQA